MNSKTKLFAFFLPQFHCIPENDEWWGKGFTEWTNVKNAKPLFWRHRQPIHPINQRYYNLLDKKTVLWQTNLMKEYGLSGFIYYHYYFCGKLLLEKPAENLLKWQEIQQPFFFCWANHSWRRTWEGKSEILREQTYGVKEDWEKHFQYLLPFFKDSRYEKKENRPLFMIFKPDFDEKEEMMVYFDQRCKENGFNGICVIETCWEYADASSVGRAFEKDGYRFYREPNISYKAYHRNRNLCQRAITKLRRIYSGMEILDGNFLFSFMKKACLKDKRDIPGLFFAWDNTSRHKKRGYIITPIRKKTFLAYMDQYKDKDYIFFNAWNEWCEGMILEPSEEYGYKYLSWIREWYEK